MNRYVACPFPHDTCRRCERPSACRQRPSFPEISQRSHGYRYESTAANIRGASSASARKCSFRGWPLVALRHPSLDGSLEARKREDSVGLLSPRLRNHSPRASLLGLRNGSTASFARFGSAFRSRLHSRHTSSLFGGTVSGASSQHNKRVSVSNVSLALGRARA